MTGLLRLQLLVRFLSATTLCLCFGVPVTDNLRDRIAAVAIQHHTAEKYYCKWTLQCECDAKWRSPEEWSRHVADAVIRELGLQKRSETGEIVDRDGGEPIKYGRHRYVTEWSNDE